ncbi:hypothetical protein [Vulcanococcus limneticus]|uniref:hypothetical protein n=1 Tax=Vulcanococcus limneticus TaxID=2170428 RepID=UPI00398BDE7F
MDEIQTKETQLFLQLGRLRIMARIDAPFLEDSAELPNQSLGMALGDVVLSAVACETSAVT